MKHSFQPYLSGGCVIRVWHGGMIHYSRRFATQQEAEQNLEAFKASILADTQSETENDNAPDAQTAT